MVEAKDRIRKAVRDNLLRRAEELNLTQTEIARRMNVTRQTIGHYFTGANTPTVEMLVGLARVLDCKVDDLLEGYDDKTNN